MLETNFPQHWKKIRLSSIFIENTQKNTNFDESHALQFYFGTIIPKKKFDIDEGLIETYKQYILVQPNDIVINGLNLNYDFVSQRVGLVEEKGIITSAYIVLRPKENVNFNYYVYFLKSLDAQKIFHGMGSGVRLTLSYKNLRNIYLPLPPREEQEKIVRYLDEKTSAMTKFIDAKTKQVELLEELKRSIISKAVTKGLFNSETPDTWQKIRLKYVAKNISEKNKYIGGNYIGLENIESWSGKINLATFENESDVESMLNSFDNRFVLFSKLRPYLAKVAAPNFEGQCSTELLTLLPQENMHRKFLFYLMISKKFIDKVDSAAYGTKMPRTNWNFIGNIKIFLPPLWEQKEITDYLDWKCGEIENLIDALKKEIELVKELQKSLISNVVTGKMEV